MASYIKVQLKSVSELGAEDDVIFCSGYRKTDGQLVCVKQVPKTRVHQLVQFDTRSVPKEFDMHIKAAKCSNVVKVYFFYWR